MNITAARCGRCGRRKPVQEKISEISNSALKTGKTTDSRVAALKPAAWYLTCWLVGRGLWN